MHTPRYVKERSMQYYELDGQPIGKSWVEVRDVAGATEERIHTATSWREVARANCYCCSCPPDATDPFCRNHGGTEGERPCEKHNMPGTPLEDGFMPLSVEAALQSLASGYVKERMGE
jgi:FtsP/CotA-like multicopper oxidase with cupredoxin domain